MIGVAVFPIDVQSTLLKGPERKHRLCPFLPVFLLFIIKATTAPMMITAPKTTRAAMITMLESEDGGGSGKDMKVRIMTPALCPDQLRVCRRLQLSLTPVMHPHSPYPISG